MSSQRDDSEGEASGRVAVDGGRRPRAAWRPAVVKFLRRIHLYAGLFLLPWVFLYGITGAMFNHYGLLPAADIYPVNSAALSESELSQLPTAEDLAAQVVAALQERAGGARIVLAPDHGSAFNNDIILETRIEGKRHVVHINPVHHAAEIVVPPENEELKAQRSLVPDVRSVRLQPNPYEMARSAVPDILAEAGFATGTPAKPLGWCKLNFLAEVNGEKARVTYVLRDGHVDITKYTGDDGMIPRASFLRMHTFHGRSPDSSARNIWSLFIDIMAIAMVTWGITGLVMWWQLKSLRLVGGVVLGLSLITAIWIYLSMVDFHAMTKM